jgi:hypothetical protein
VVGWRWLRERLQRFQAALDLVFALVFAGLGTAIVIKECAALGVG